MEDMERKELEEDFGEEDDVVSQLEETLKYLDSARKIVLASAVISAVAVACMVIGILARGLG